MLASIADCRRLDRARLLELRNLTRPTDRLVEQGIVERALSRVIETIGCRTLGIYWPIKREIDIRAWANRLSFDTGIELALPVVVRPHQPLEYWRWRAGDSMKRGHWGIPVPYTPKLAQPDVVISPLVGVFGFYRLGYGGGYFDRTLAARNPRPIAIGIGFDNCRLDRFEAQPHDIPMDVIVTEQQVLLGDRQTMRAAP